jgi:hypothetical protein
MTATLTREPDLYSDLDGMDRRLTALERIVGYIAPGSVNSNALGEGAVTDFHIADDSIRTRHVFAEQIEANHIKSRTITAIQIKAGEITAFEIAANTISADNIAANAITSVKILADAVKATHIDVTSLSAITENVGVLTGGIIRGPVIETSENNPKVIMDSSGIRAITSGGTALFDLNATTGKLTATGVIIAETGSQIPSGYITGQLTAGQIASVNAASILGSISAEQFAGNFSSGNLIVNAGFEDVAGAMTNWAAVNGSGATATTPVRHGTKSLQLTSNGGGALSINKGANRASVTDGQTYVVSAYFRAATVGRTCRIDLNWHDATGALISTSTSSTITSTTTDWTRHSYSAVAPANAVSVNPVFVSALSGAVNGEIHYIDSVQLEVGNVASAFSPGVSELLPGSVGEAEIAANAVTAVKIVGGTITGDKIYANALNTPEINALKIQVGSMAADSIAALQIAAGTIATDHLQAGIIKASQLMINQTTINVMPNTSFEQNTDGWAGLNATLARVSTPFYHPFSTTDSEGQPVTPTGWSARLTCTVAGSIVLDSVSARPAISAGKVITFSIYVRSATVSRQVNVNLQFFDNGTPATDTTDALPPAVLSGGSFFGTAVATSTTGWTRVTVTATAPAGSYSVRPYVLVAGCALNEQHYFDAAQLEYAGAASTYIPNGIELIPSTVLPTLLTAEGITGDKIMSRSINTINIAADAITAREIRALTITGNEIKGDTIEGTKIKAGHITAAHISMNFGGTNMLENPSFEGTLVGTWDATVNCTVQTSTARQYHGTRALRVLAIAAGTVHATNYNARVPVKPGTTYTMSGYASNSNNKNAQARIWFLDASNAQVGSAIGVSTPTDGLTWTRVDVSAVAPANAVTAEVAISFLSVAVGENNYVDAVQFEAGEKPTAFSPFPESGITGTEITPSSISTPHLVATAIDTMNVTLTAGGRVQTKAGARNSVGNAKVQMDATGFWAQDAAGTVTIDIVAATGNVTITGKLNARGVDFPTTRDSTNNTNKIRWVEPAGVPLRAQIDGFYDSATGFDHFTQRNALYVQTFSSGSIAGATSGMSSKHDASGNHATIETIVDTRGGVQKYGLWSDLKNQDILRLNGPNQGTDSYIRLNSAAATFTISASNNGGGLYYYNGGTNIGWLGSDGTLWTQGNIYIYGGTVHYGDPGQNPSGGPWRHEWEVGTGRLVTARFLNGSGTWWASFVNPGSGDGQFDLVQNGPVVGTSDRKLKKNISDFKLAKDDSSISTLKKLRPRKFQWKSTKDNETYDLGLVAQEVKEVYPEAIKEHIPPGHTEPMLFLEWAKITILSVAALQEQIQKVESLTARLTKLEAQMT